MTYYTNANPPGKYGANSPRWRPEESVGMSAHKEEDDRMSKSSVLGEKYSEISKLEFTSLRQVL